MLHFKGSFQAIALSTIIWLLTSVSCKREGKKVFLNPAWGFFCEIAKYALVLNWLQVFMSKVIVTA